MNVPFVYLPEGADSTANANNYKCNLRVSGKKVLCDVEDSRAIGYVYDENGNKIAGYYVQDAAESNVSNAALVNDNRVAGGLFAFTISQAMDSATFNQYALAVEQLLQDFGSAYNNHSDNPQQIIQNIPEVKYAARVMANDIAIKLLQGQGHDNIDSTKFETAVLYCILSNYGVDLSDTLSNTIPDDDERNLYISLAVDVLRENSTIGQVDATYSNSVFASLGLSIVELYGLALKSDYSGFTDKVSICNHNISGDKYAQVSFNVSDDVVVKLVEKLASGLITVDGGNIALNGPLMQMMSKPSTVAQYLLYGMGVLVNDNNDMVLQLIYPMGSSYPVPTVLLVYTGFKFDPNWK